MRFVGKKNSVDWPSEQNISSGRYKGDRAVCTQQGAGVFSVFVPGELSQPKSISSFAYERRHDFLRHFIGAQPLWCDGPYRSHESKIRRSLISKVEATKND
jgi:hypothetical protein